MADATAVVQAVSAGVTAVATGILVWITHRAGQRSDEAIAAATDNAEASREATEVIARQAWGARLAFVDEVLVTGTEAERNERILWFVQNLGMAPARLELVRLAIGSYEPSVFPSGAEAYVPGRAELATSSKKEVAVPISQPRVLDVGGLIPEHARMTIYYVDDLGLQSLTWPIGAEPVKPNEGFRFKAYRPAAARDGSPKAG